MFVALLGGILRHLDRSSGPKRAASRMRRLAGFMLSEVLLLWVVFNAVNFGFSLGLDLRSSPTESIVSHVSNGVVIVLGLFIVGVVLACLFK